MIAPVAVVVALLITLLPSSSVDSVEAPSRASQTQCLPYQPPRSVKSLNQLVDSLRSGGEFQGGDVGASTTLSDGRRVWVFGDTLRSAGFDGERFVRNSMLVFGDRCADVVLPADHGALIPNRADGIGYWPMSIATVKRAGYDIVGVAANRVSSTGSAGDVFAFRNLGPALALFIVANGKTPQLLSVQDLGPDDPSKKRPAWGAAVAVEGEWVYLYGTANPEEELVFGYSLRVARVKIDDIQTQSKWRYWNGARWSKEAADALELIKPVGGVSQTLSVFKSGKSWYAVSKRDEFVGSDLVIWKAPAPTGPFTASAPVAEIPSEAQTLRYMPLAHPGLLPEKGTVVVSYSQNTTDIDLIVDDPFLYRPRFLRVPLP